MTHRMLGLVAILIFMGMMGCATNPETGERMKLKALAPSPPEATLIARQVMRLAITSQDLDAAQLAEIRLVMLDAQSVLLTGLKEDPANLDMVRLHYLSSKNAEVGSLANTVLAVLTYRLRPLVDKGKTDLAAQYIEAVISGAVQAIDAVPSG